MAWISRSITRYCALFVVALLVAGGFTAARMTLVDPPAALANENTITTGWTKTTTQYASNEMTEGAQIGTVETTHYAYTTLSYPAQVRAGVSFQYVRCVKQVFMEETSGYEAAMDRVTLDASSAGFSITYTQASVTRNVNLCRTYTATAPTTAGTNRNITLPQARVGRWGGVGYAGSCCPTWGIHWNGQFTRDNAITVDVYTNPDAQDDHSDVLVGTSATVDVLANDAGFGTGDLPGTPIDLIIQTQATNGTCSVVAGKVEYVNNGVSGDDSCVYAVNQAETDAFAPNEPTTATVGFFVNEPPIAVDDVGVVSEDGVISFDVTSNDTDHENHTLTVISYSAAPSGTTSFTGNTLTFDPGDDFDYLTPGRFADTTLRYTIDDGHLGQDVGTVRIRVTGEYDAPQVIEETTDVPENGPAVTFDPRTNDRYPDYRSTITMTSIDTTDTTGEANLGDNTITYDPNRQFEWLAEGETATDEVTYTISDGKTTASGRALLRVVGSNDPMVAIPDEATTSEDDPIVIDAVANDVDADASDVLTATTASIVSGGGAVSIDGGKVRWDPLSDYQYLAVGETATVHLNYTGSDPHGQVSSSSITVTVTGTNDGPTATDDTLSVDEDTVGSVQVLSEVPADSDPDTDDVLRVASVTQPSAGSASFDDTSVSFDPGQDFQHLAVGATDSTSFSYTATDDNGGSDSATVSVTVTGLNDAPVAAADLLTIGEDDLSAHTIDVMSNDSDIDDGSSISFVDLQASPVPDYGGTPTNVGSTVSFQITDGRYNDLSAGEHVSAMVQYTIQDEHGATAQGTLEIRIEGANDAPTATDAEASTDQDAAIDVTALVENGSDPDRADTLSLTGVDDSATQGTASVVDGAVHYDPAGAWDHLAPGETAVDTVTFTLADDHGATVNAVLRITVTGLNDAPTAVTDYSGTDEQNPVTVDALLNDTDVDGPHNELVLVSAQAPVGLGSATVVAGQVHFDPAGEFERLAPGESEDVTVSYVIADGDGAQSQGQIIITVTGVNDAPGGERACQVLEDDTLTLGTEELGATDPDSGDTVVATAIATQPSHGAASLTTGTVTYTPDSQWNALAEGETQADSMVLDIEDAHGATGTYTAQITIVGVNDAPVALNDTTNVTDRKVVQIPVLDNDTDPDTSDQLRVVSVTSNGPGTFSVVDGVVTYDGGDAFMQLVVGSVLQVSYTYTITDDHGGQATATGVLRVQRTLDNTTDADGNGIPDWWEVENGTGPGSMTLPDTLAQCPDANDLLRISAAIVSTGGQVEVEGSQAWLPESTVTYYICSTPQILKSVTAGADGTANTVLTVPAGLDPATHRIVGVGLSMSGDTLVQTSEVSVTTTSTGGSGSGTGGSTGGGSTGTGSTGTGGSTGTTGTSGSTGSSGTSGSGSSGSGSSSSSLAYTGAGQSVIMLILAAGLISLGFGLRRRRRPREH
ncbi:MAG: Ig-like domain-containing protein [Actinomycetales bacterium]